MWTKYATEHRMEIVMALLYQILCMLENNPKLLNLSLVTFCIMLLMLKIVNSFGFSCFSVFSAFSS